MVSGVDELAAPARRPSCPPTQAVGVDRQRENVGGAGAIHLAQPAVANHLPGRCHSGQKQLVVRAHQGDTRVGDRACHRARLLDGQAQGFFAQDVLASLGRRHDRILVQVMR